jgi:hypothetical protein
MFTLNFYFHARLRLYFTTQMRGSVSGVLHPNMEENALPAKEAVSVRRSTRIAPKMLPKVTKEPPKKGPTTATTQTKAAQLEKILRSKTPGPKIEKPSLTSEEIDEDIILMGILPATISKLRSPLQTHSKKASQSLSAPMSSTINDNDQELPGTFNVRVEAELPQPGMSFCSLQKSMNI